VVTTEEFGRAVNDEVRAMFDGPAKSWGGKGVVDAKERTPAVGDSRQRW